MSQSMRDASLVVQEMKTLSEQLCNRVQEVMSKPISFSIIMHEHPEMEFEPDRAFEKQQMVIEIASKLAKNNMELKSLLMLLGADYSIMKD